MRRLFAIALIALLLGVGVVAIIETDPGYVLVTYGNYTLESSLWVGLLLLLLLVFSVYLLFRLAYRIIGGQRSLFSWFDVRRTRKAARLSTRGFINFTEGNWATARSQLVRGAQNNDAPLVNYLLAARSSAQINDNDKVHEYLRAAGDAEPDATTAVEFSLAEMKLQSGEYQGALAALDQSIRQIGRHPHVLNLMKQAYLGLQDWDKLLDLLPQLKKHKQLSGEELQELERKVHSHRLGSAGADVGQLHAIWGQVPRPLQQDGAIAEIYVCNLIALGDHQTAEQIILRSLKREWSPALVRQFGYIAGGDVTRQLSRAKKWLTAHPEDAELLLCLGRLSARAELWGKARDYFESSYRLHPGAEVCAELGRLLSGLGEADAATAYFREGLLLSADQLPDLPVPDKVVAASAAPDAS